jgi:hypothetical protein
MLNVKCNQYGFKTLYRDKEEKEGQWRQVLSTTDIIKKITQKFKIT